MSHKMHIKYILIPAFIVLISGAILLYAHMKKPTFQEIKQTESSVPANNPYCGFYHLYGYKLSEEGNKPAQKWVSQVLTNDDNTIALLQINLIHYRSQPISDKALSQLDSIITSFADANKQIILRFLYDWDGKALQSEPSSIEQITSHMDDVAPIVNAHKDHIFLLQGIFTGNCGEMNQTNYGSNDDIRYLMNHLDSAISPEIFLAVRTPAHLRSILGTSAPFSDASPYDGSLYARLGLFNDGMFGDEFDCGTYDDTPFAETSDITQKGTRKEELSFQNSLCAYVPNGGEAVLDNPYNDLDKAIPDLFQMHVSYLSCEHDGSVLNKWKKTSYPGKDPVFAEASGYDYIRDHLGYRYVIKNTDISYSGLFSSQIQADITIENRGFSPCYRPFDVQLTLESVEGNISSFPISFDTRTIDSMQTQHLSVTFKRSDLPKGDYKLRLKLTDIATKCNIYFANTCVEKDGSAMLGTLHIF